MPTTSNPARTSNAAVNEESTPPHIPTTNRWSEGLPGRSRLAGCIQAHLPEIGLQPGGRREARRQGREAPLAPAASKLLVERRRAVAGQALVFRPGIHLEPFAIRIA